MLSAYLTVLGGLALLIFGADRFVLGAARTARGLGISPLIIGMTIVGFATSAPEVLVGSVAAWEGKTTIAIGNALGSNIANIGMVLGITVLFSPLVVTSKTLRREFWLMCIAVLIALSVTLDHYLSRLDGFILLVCLIGITGWVVKLARASSATDPLMGEFEKELESKKPIVTSLFLLFAGLALLLGGSLLLVHGAVIIAKSFGISDLVIGLTVIAIGTSLPELAASIACVIKDEADIAIGNIIGSNMFNMLMVLGVPALIQPSGFSSEVLYRDFPVMIGMIILMGWMVFIHGRGKFDRLEGGVLLACFVSYQFWLFHSIAA